MAFKGDLTNISLFDVFQTLNQNQQSGVLVLTRDGHTKKIKISPEGVRVFFTRSFRPLRLGEIFTLRGRITPQDVEILLLEQKKDYRPFGELMIATGKVSAEEVRDVLRYHAEDEIFEIFGWNHGTFAFYDGQDQEETSTPLSEVLMDPAGLCLEAARRLDEMERLRERIPSNDEFFLQRDGIEPDRAQTSESILELYDCLAAPHSVEDLRDLVGLSIYDALKALHLLLENDLIRALDRDELVATARTERDAGRVERATRLLETAHMRDPGDQHVIEECIASLERVGQPKRLARMLSTLGMLLLEEGHVDRAVEHLEQSLRHDSSNFTTLIALRDAFADQGDDERVGETSLKIARHQADAGDLFAAIDSARAGLEAAPTAIGLRFYYAQLLAKADRAEETQEELYGLIREVEQSKRAKSPKMMELLGSCFRLLLKIDPHDTEAQAGLRELDRAQTTTEKRKKFVIGGSIAAGLLAVIAVAGITLGGASAPTDLLNTVYKNERGNPQEALRVIDELVAEYPESPETQTALAIRNKIRERMHSAKSALSERQTKIRTEVAKEYQALKTAVNELPYLAAAQQVQTFLRRLDHADTRFLHAKYGDAVRYDLGLLVERATKQFDADRNNLAKSERELKKAKTPLDLAALEQELGEIRRRNWPELAPELIAKVAVLYKHRLTQAGAASLAELRKGLEGAPTAFGGFDALFYAVRSARLKLEIQDAVQLAKTRGVELLRQCEFDEARKLFAAAYKKADAVTDEEPREYFVPLLRWLHQLRVLGSMKADIEKIDDVVATLKEVETLRQGNTDAAYRLLRDLVTRYRLIQFEQKYTLPYVVETTPSGADVFVDGVRAGASPCTIELKIGIDPVDIRIERKGFADRNTRFVPTDPKLDGMLAVPLEKKPAWTVRIAGVTEARPVIADGKLLVATHRATLVAYDLATGDVEWEADPKQLERVTARPLVAGKYAYLINVAGKIFKVRLRDGKIVESLDAGGPVHNDGVYAKGVLYVATRTPKLVAFRDGKQLFSVPLAHGPTTGLLLHQNKLCIGTAEGRILVHDVAEGQEVAQLRTRTETSFFGGLAKQRDNIVAGAEDGKLYAFALDKETPLWSYRTRGPIAAAPINVGDLLHLPARDGFIHTVTADGRGKVRYDIGAAVDTPPALSNGFLYAVGGNRVKAFDTVGEEVWWELSLKDEFPQHIVSGSGYVAVITNGPRIYVFPKDVR